MLHLTLSRLFIFHVTYDLYFLVFLFTLQSNLLVEPLTKLNEVMERGMKIISWDSLVLDEYIDLCKLVSAVCFLFDVQVEKCPKYLN